MSTPDHVDVLAEELLEAARSEAPSAEARARAMASLGVTPPGGGGGTPQGDGSGAATATGGTGVGLKGAAIVTLAGLAALALWRVSSVGAPVATPAPHEPPTSTARSPETVEPALAPSSAASLSPGAQEPAAPASPLASASAGVRPAGEASSHAHRPRAPTVADTAAHVVAPPPAAASASSDARRGDDLAAELAELERARARLRTGDATGALSLLDAHAAHHPKGVLSTEATLLRVEALVAAGRMDEAKRVAGPLVDRRDLTGERARRLLAR